MTFLSTIVKENRRLLFVFLAAALMLVVLFPLFVSTGELSNIRAGIADPDGIRIEQLSAFSVFLLIAASTLVSEDLAAISAGVLAGQGRIDLALALAGAGFGIFFGDILLFLAGRLLGRRALEIPLVRFFISKEAFDKSSRWLERQGLKTVFISRFVFGLRLPLYFAAGVLNTSFWRFTLYFSLAVAVWTPLIVGLTYWLGAEIVQNSLLSRNLWLALVVVAAGSFLVLRTVQQLLTWRSRRLLWGRIKRRFLWEFWSLRVFYFPVVLYVAWLAVKHRSLTVFTCANPAILAGGFVGESKNEIFRGLQKSQSAAPFLLRHVFIPGFWPVAEKLNAAEDFLVKNRLDFPVVVKPDVGERGAGVEIIKNPTELEARLAGPGVDLILQEFAAGEEVSVFYYRFPSQPRGQIFAITEKHFPRLTGDGRSTLEQLILKDKRAVCLAKSYLERNREKLESVPAEGEEIPIIDIGTHSRGAVFLDGGWMRSDALEKCVDEICRGYDGFYFGRFDIRTESFAAFREAKNFKIVELNGVTSEATNIYDPRYSLLDAYRILFRQWQIAFEIGVENCRRGARPTPLKELILLVLSKNKKNQTPQSGIQNAECA